MAVGTWKIMPVQIVPTAMNDIHLLTSMNNIGTRYEEKWYQYWFTWSAQGCSILLWTALNRLRFLRVFICLFLKGMTWNTILEHLKTRPWGEKMFHAWEQICHCFESTQGKTSVIILASSSYKFVPSHGPFSHLKVAFSNMALNKNKSLHNNPHIMNFMFLQ